MKKLLFKPQNISLIISILIGLLAFFYINFIPGGKRMELASYDFRLNLFGRIDKFDDKIVVIGIDSDTIDKLGFLPYPRSIYADLIDKLSEFNPSVIAFDIEFDTDDRFSIENDKDFARAIEESGKVILASTFEVKEISPFTPEKKVFRFLEPKEEFKEVLSRTGYVKIDPDLDDTIRKVRLALPDRDKWKLQFDLAIISLLEGVKPEEIDFKDDRIIVGKRIIPVNKNQEIYINYPSASLSSGGGLKYTFKPLSFYKVLEEDFSISGEGWIFIVGGYYNELGDVHKTPDRREFGVKIHASILNTIIKESYIYRSGKLVNLFIVFLASVLLGLLLHRFNAKIGIVITLLFIIIFLGLNFFLFYKGIWIDFYTPLLTILISFVFH